MLKSAWGLIVIGLVLLIAVIPLSGKITDQRGRTDFLSARSAYWCIVAGTILLLLHGVDECIIDALIAIRR